MKKKDDPNTPLFGFMGDRPKPLGEVLKEDGMARVLDNAGDDWISRATTIARGLTGRQTGESIRFACESAGVVPHDPHAWGALTSSLVRSGLFLPTSEYVSMVDPRSHARKTRVYVRA